MKLVFVAFCTFISLPYFTQVTECNCYASTWWPLPKKKTIALYQQVNTINKTSTIYFYSPQISYDTIGFLISGNSLKWKVSKFDESWIDLTAQEVPLNNSFNIYRGKEFNWIIARSNTILFSNKLVETSNATMLYKLTINNRKGLKRLAFKSNKEKVFCFRKWFLRNTDKQ